MANITLDTGVLQALFENLRTNALLTILLAALYSLLAAAVSIAIHSLLRVGLRSLPNKLNLVAVTIMFSLATLYAIVRTLQLWSAFDLFTDSFDTGINAVAGKLEPVVFAVNVVLGDAILLWRAVVIWSWQKRILYPSILLLCTNIVFWVVGYIRDSSAMEIPPSVATSLWATALVSIRAWQRRRMLHKKVAIMSRRDALGNLFNIFTESGIVYSLLWIITLISVVVDTNIDLINAMTVIMIVAASLYPTIIVILVAKNKTPISNQLTTIEPMTVMDPSESRDLFGEDSDAGKEVLNIGES